MKKIITVTLNPSLDETLITRHLNLGYYNHVAGNKHLDASGRGVNVSRALARLHVPTHAVIVLGDDTIGRAYRSLIIEEGFPTTIIRYPGPTRSDIIILDEVARSQTHIVDEDTVGPRHNIDALLEAITEIAEVDDIVVLAGNLPRETPADVYARMTEAAHQAGAKVVIMTRDDPLQLALNAVPETIVLSQREAESLFNYPVRTLADLKICARKFQDRGCITVIGVSNDYGGAVLADIGRVWTAENTQFNFTGTDSGLIDAMLAGYLTAQLQGKGLDDAFRLGMAALSYSAGQVGNEFGTMQQIQEHEDRIAIQELPTEEQAQT